MALALRDREAVFHAVAEFDQLGREAFLKKYGFGKAKEYYLRLDGEVLRLKGYRRSSGTCQRQWDTLRD